MSEHGGSGDVVFQPSPGESASPQASSAPKPPDTKTLCICFTDIETGGLSPLESDIIEIGCVVVHPIEGVVARWSEKMMPTRPVHPDAARVNGYEPETWSKQVVWTRIEVLRSYAALSAGCVFASHGTLDHQFLEYEMRVHGIDWKLGSYRKIDTCAMAWPLYTQGILEGNGLEKICKHYGIENKNAHSALSDAEACMKAYFAMMETFASAFKLSAQTEFYKEQATLAALAESRVQQLLEDNESLKTRLTCLEAAIESLMGAKVPSGDTESFAHLRETLNNAPIESLTKDAIVVKMALNAFVQMF